jgi:hypothetical protein
MRSCFPLVSGPSRSHDRLATRACLFLTPVACCHYYVCHWGGPQTGSSNGHAGCLHGLYRGCSSPQIADGAAVVQCRGQARGRRGEAIDSHCSYS